MSVENQQELLKLVEAIAMRMQTCENITDKTLMARALEYLVDYQAYVSRRIE